MMIIVAKGSLKSSLRADFLVPFPLLDTIRNNGWIFDMIFLHKKCLRVML